MKPVLSIIPVDPRDPEVAMRIYSLQQEAYTFEAEQIGCIEFPPLRETAEELRKSLDQFIVIASGETLLGALSFCESASDVTLTRLVVRPQHHRQGIGTRLLSELERRLPSKDIFVTTAQKNHPTIKLYERNGFGVSSLSLSREGIQLIHFRKVVSRPE